MKILPVVFLVLCAIAVSVLKVDAKPFQYLDLIIEDDVAKEEIESRTFFWKNKPEKENHKKLVILLVEDDVLADDTEGSDEVVPQKPQYKRKTIIKSKKVERPVHTHYHDSREDDTDSNEYEHKYSNENKHNLYANDDKSEEVDYDNIYRPYPGRFPQSPAQGNSGPSTPWGFNSWETPAWTTEDSEEHQDHDYEGDTYEYNGEEAEDMDIPTGSEEEAVFSRIESGGPFDSTEYEADKSSEKPENLEEPFWQGEQTENPSVESGDVEGDTQEQIATDKPDTFLISQEETENVTQRALSGESLELPVNFESHSENTDEIVPEDIQIVTTNTREITTKGPEDVLISQDETKNITQGPLSGEDVELNVSTTTKAENTVEIAVSKETKNSTDQGSTSKDESDDATKVKASNNEEDSVTNVENNTDKETGVTEIADESDAQQETIAPTEGSETVEDELFKHYYYHVPQPILLTYFQRRPTEEDGQNSPEQDPDEPRSGFRLGSLQHKAKRVIKKIVKNKYKIINRKTDDLLG